MESNAAVALLTERVRDPEIRAAVKDLATANTKVVWAESDANALAAYFVMNDLRDRVPDLMGEAIRTLPPPTGTVALVTSIVGPDREDLPPPT